MLLPVASTARTSSVSSSMAMCTLRQMRAWGHPLPGSTCIACARGGLAGVPLAFTLGLDAGAGRCPAGHCAAMFREGISRFSGPTPPRYGIATFSCRWRRHSVLNSGTAQCRPTSRRRLCTNPAVCLSGIPNSTFSVRQVWIAALLNWHRRPRLPVGGGVQIILGSNPMVRDPRCFSASLQDDQFVVLYLVGAQLLMHPSYHAGFRQ